MLARLTAILERVDDDAGLLVFQGPGEGVERAYEVLLPAYLRERLAERTGQLVTLFTIELLESPDGGSSFTPRIIGFGSPAERKFFQLLTTVKGVGTKKALRALAAPVDEIARAISIRDAGGLSKLPGIGKRMAETVIAELHGKVDPFVLAEADAAGLDRASGSGAGVRGASDPVRRAVAALVRLGESEHEAERLIKRALEAEPGLSQADELVAAALGQR